MNVAVTGHTRGLGESIFKKFELNGHRVVGFSKSTGYDISDSIIRQKIVSSVSDIDIFINNAYADFSQTQLLYELFKSWSGKKKIILNISSTVTIGVVPHIWSYASHKQALDKASEQLAFLNDTCQVVNFKFGWIGTERVLEKFKPHKYMKPESVADFIYEQLEVLEKFRLTEVILRPQV